MAADVPPDADAPSAGRAPTRGPLPRQDDGNRIGYVLKVFPRVSETFVINEIRALERVGERVAVFSLHAPPTEVRHGILREMASPIFCVERDSEPTPREIRKATALLAEHFGIAEEERRRFLPRRYVRLSVVLARLAQANRVGHLHAHFASRAAHVAALAAPLAGCSFSVTAHAKDIYHEEVDRDVLRWKMTQAGFVVTVTDYNRRFLAELLGDGDTVRRVFRVYNGIDLRRFAAVPYDAATARRIVAVGRLVPKKGFDVLVDACALLRRDGVPFSCEIIGGGAGEAALRAQIEARGLSSFVSLGGSLTTEEVEERLGSAALVALPCVVGSDGNVDALPTVLLEAMGTARPVVSTRLSGIPEIVADGETGLLVPPNDAAQLASALRLLLEDPTRAAAMGNAGRARAEALFDLDRNAAEVRRLIRDLRAPVDAR